jgi:hypothetical protein
MESQAPILEDEGNDSARKRRKLMQTDYFSQRVAASLLAVKISM